MTDKTKRNKAEREKKITEIRSRLGKEKPYHYFASSALNWSADSDLLVCLTRQRAADTNKKALFQCSGCLVYRVEGKSTRTYEIENCRPSLPDDEVKFIDTIVY